MVWYGIFVPYYIPYHRTIPDLTVCPSESKMQADLTEAILRLCSSLFEDVSAISTNTPLKKYMLFHDLLSQQIWKFSEEITDLHVIVYAVTLFYIGLITKTGKPYA